jgi:hypothetical protein
VSSSPALFLPLHARPSMTVGSIMTVVVLVDRGARLQVVNSSSCFSHDHWHSTARILSSNAISTMTPPRQFVFWVYGDAKYTKLTASVDDLDSSVYDLKHVIHGILNSQLKGEIRYSCDSIELYEVRRLYHR